MYIIHIHVLNINCQVKIRCQNLSFSSYSSFITNVNVTENYIFVDVSQWKHKLINLEKTRQLIKLLLIIQYDINNKMNTKSLNF